MYIPKRLAIGLASKKVAIHHDILARSAVRRVSSPLTEGSEIDNVVQLVAGSAGRAMPPSSTPDPLMARRAGDARA